MSRYSGSQDALLENVVQSLRKYSTKSVIFHQQMAQKIGILHTDMKTAQILNETGPLTAGELAKHTGLTTGAVTALIGRLETAGFVTRQQDPDDRRKTVIIPIKERHNDILAHFGSLAVSTKETCRDYSPAELETIIQFIQSVTGILEAETERLQ